MHVHDKDCGGPYRKEKAHQEIDKKVRKHFAKGNHKYNKNGYCSKCNYTRSEVYRIERNLAHDYPNEFPAHTPRY